MSCIKLDVLKTEPFKELDRRGFKSFRSHWGQLIKFEP